MKQTTKSWNEEVHFALRRSKYAQGMDGGTRRLVLCVDLFCAKDCGHLGMGQNQSEASGHDMVPLDGFAWFRKREFPTLGTQVDCSTYPLQGSRQKAVARYTTVTMASRL